MVHAMKLLELFALGNGSRRENVKRLLFSIFLLLINNIYFYYLRTFYNRVHFLLLHENFKRED